MTEEEKIIGENNYSASNIQVLEGLENGTGVEAAKIRTRGKARTEEQQQMAFVDENAELLKRRLREADVDAMSPRDALNLLYELKKLV